MSVYSTVKKSLPETTGVSKPIPPLIPEGGAELIVALEDGKSYRVEGLMLAPPAGAAAEEEKKKEREEAWKPFIAKVAEYFPSETVIAYTLLDYLRPDLEYGAWAVALVCLVLNVVLFMAYQFRATKKWLIKGAGQGLALSCLAYAVWAILLHGDDLLSFVIAPATDWLRFVVAVIVIGVILVAFVLYSASKVLPPAPKT